MVPDLTLEVIYLNQPTDFKMEFDLCSASNVRFLSASVKSRAEFLTVLGKSVVRSRAIITVGSFNPLDSEYLPRIIAKATGYVLKPVDKELFKIITPGEFSLPDTALPLVDALGNITGCVLENNDQSIIMLTSDREKRHRTVTELVCPYLKVFANKDGGFEKTTSEPKQSEAEAADLSDQASEDTNQTEPTPEKAEQDGDITQGGATDVADVTEPEPDYDAVDEEMSAEHEQGNEEPTKYTVLEQPENTDNRFDLEDFLANDPDYDDGKKPKKRRGVLKVIISVLLVAAVCLCTYFGYEWVFQPMQKESVYAETRELYGQTWGGLPEDMLYKFGKLYKTNSDIYGWINIPDTSINFPVVSTAGKSENYYESHLFEGSVNRFGTPYTNAVLGEGEYTRNIVIYGKDIKQGTMFSELKNYLDIEQYRKAPTFTFDTLYVENKWKIFSVFKLTESKEKTYIKTDFFDDDSYLEYLNLLDEISLIDTNIDLAIDDQIVTLVCRSDGDDVVVAARRVRDGESPLVDVTGSSLNDDSFSSSAVEAITTPSGLTEITSNESNVSSEDANMADGASSRFEQQAPVSSAITVKPSGTVSSKPSSISNSSSKVSSTGSSSKETSTSKKPASSSNTASAVTSAGKLPTLTVTNSFTGKKVSGPANEIVAQILEAEMGSGYHIEALKAQAVAAYSWLLCNGAASGKAPSAPMRTADARATQAANDVAGQVAVYGGNVAQTYYYAISAGRTANSKDIWSSQLPYLVSVDSSVDKSVSGYQTIRSYSASDVAKWAEESLGIKLTNISDKSKWFTCTYDANGVYCSQVKIGTVTKKGTYLRDSFFTASRVGSKNVLRSSAYTISYNKSDDKFVFTVRGYGHGVGMSQTGANAYAKSGWNYEKILKHYYTGITLGTYYAD